MSGIIGKSKGHATGLVQKYPANVPACDLLGAHITTIFPNNTLSKIYYFKGNITDSFDTHGMWDNTAQKFVIPAGSAGVYSFCLQVSSHSVDDGEISTFQMVIDGHTANYSQNLPGHWQRYAHQTDDTMIYQAQTVIGLNAAQEVEFYWRQNSGATVGMDADFVRLAAHRVCSLTG